MVDAYLYGSVLRIMEWTIAAYDRLGTVRQRTGNQPQTIVAPLDNFASRDSTVCVRRRLCSQGPSSNASVPGYEPARVARSMSASPQLSARRSQPRR